MPLIEVQDLTKEFRTFRRREGVKGAIQNLFVREYLTVRAVDHISFSINAGEMVGYIGANGAGKSTTIKVLTGILVPSSGRVISNGYRPLPRAAALHEAHRRGVRPAHAALVGHRGHRILQTPQRTLRESRSRTTAGGWIFSARFST